MKMIYGKTFQEWCELYPLVKDLVSLNEISWFNPSVKKASEVIPQVGLSLADIDDAATRLKRFAPLLSKAFPETCPRSGILESALEAAPHFQKLLDKYFKINSVGKLLLKLDSRLPVSGTIKARGGIYEILKFAEELLITAGKLKITDDYSKLVETGFKDFLSHYSIVVGSTGDLGLAVGILCAKLGFKARVHLSANAKRWKVDKLREYGVTVIEHHGDYLNAVAEGREEAQHMPNCHFVDVDNSKHLFLGYAVAAQRLADQLQALDIVVDEDHPLFVYLPSSGGGAPSGLTFGLKVQFGDAVHCIFSEATHAPCLLLGVYTGLLDKTSVQDFGIDTMSDAEGMAIGRSSGFISKALQYLVDGYLTLADDEMYRLLTLLAGQEKIYVEPSATAGIPGLYRVLTNKAYLERMKFTAKQLENATHIAWITGGSMVPATEMGKYLTKGRGLLQQDGWR